MEEPSNFYVEGAGFVFLRLEKIKDCQRVQVTESSSPPDDAQLERDQEPFNFL